VSEVINIESDAKVYVPPAPATPMRLVEMAVSQNADVDKLTKLMDLQERWEAKQAHKAYCAAIAEFQSRVPTIHKKKAGHGYKYAPLEDIFLSVQPILRDCGLSVTFGEGQPKEGDVAITCIVTHREGHQQATPIRLQTISGTTRMNEAQAMAATMTYLKRYAFCSALGIVVADEDVDSRLDSDRITDEQAATLKARLQATGSDVAKFCQALGVTDVDSMPATKYSAADRMLAKKEAASANTD